MDQVILQWNTRSITRNKHDFIYLLNKYTPFVSAISETWLRPDTLFGVPGYTVLRDDRNDGWGGSALLIKNNLNFCQLPVTNSHNCINIVAIRFKNITFISIYIPKRDIMAYSILRSFLVTVPFPIILLGDFNCHNQLWGAPNNDAFGLKILEIMEEFDLCVINDGSPTRRSSPLVNPSYVDLSLCSATLASLLQWSRLSTSHGSDHFPILINFPTLNVTVPTLAPLLPFRIKKDKWEMYANTLEEKVINLPNPNLQNLTECIKQFTEAVISTAEANFQKKNHHYSKIPSPPWWDEDCTKVVKERKEAEKNCSIIANLDNYLKFKNVEAASKRYLHKRKRQGWKKFCYLISPETPSSLVWKQIRRFRCSRSHINPTSRSTNWIDEFMSNLAPQYVPLSSQIPSQYCYTNSSSNSMLDSDFSYQELKYVLQYVKDSSPGPDGIPYSFLSKGKKLFLNYFLQILNHVVNSGIIPVEWKHQIIIPLCKPNKEPTDPHSYRPIALSSTIPKIIEHLIKNRLEWFLEHNSLLARTQYGFRKGRSIADSHAILTTDVQLAFSRNESVVAGFLDISAAYDNVNLSILRQKLQQLRVTKKIAHFIFNLLSGRKISLRYPGVEVTDHMIWKGLPQGSVISPLLYDVYTADMESSLTAVCRVLQYADDVLVYSCNPSITQSAQNLTTGLNILSSWLQEHSLSLSTSKSVAVVFTRKRDIPISSIECDDSVIPIKREATFLGKVFDSKMNGISHIDRLVNKCEKNINIIRCLSGVWWGAHPFSLRLVYNAIIRSYLDFGTSLLIPANKNALKKLDTTQYKCLRIVLGAMKSSPTNSLQVESSEPPLNLRRQYLSDRFIYKISQYSTHPLIPKLKLLSEYVRTKPYWAHKPIPHLVKSFRKCNNVTCTIKKFVSHPSFSVDFNSKIFKPNIFLNIGIEKDSSNADIKLQSLVNKHWPNADLFFTDASKTSTLGSVGAAFWHFNSNIARLFKFPHYSSVFSGECLAILECIKFIREHNIVNSAIFSDSKSCVQSLIANPFGKNIICPISLEIKHLIKMCQEDDLKIAIIWIPSHTGISGNEKADELAKQAVVHGNTENFILYSYDLVALAKRDLEKSWNAFWKGSSRLKGTHLYNIQPDITFKPWFSKTRTPKQVTSTISRMRIGHCSSPVHLRKLRIRDSSICECGLEEGTLSHLMFSCPRYFSPSLYELLSKYKAPLPANLFSILSLKNKKSTSALTNFLTTHDIKL